MPGCAREPGWPLERARDGLVLPVNDRGLQELESILSSLRHLPPASTPTWRARSERALEKEIIKRRLAKLCEESAPIAAAIDAELVAEVETLFAELLLHAYEITHAKNERLAKLKSRGSLLK